MADDRPGFFDKVKAFCAVSAMFFVGGLMLWGPDEVIEDIRKEMSDELRVAVGWGAIAFGALFALTVIFASGRSKASRAIAARLKGAVLAAIMAMFFWAFWASTGARMHDAWRLRDGAGRPATARVDNRRMATIQRKTRYSYRLRYDGHRKRVRLPEDQRGRSTVPVLYLPDEPDVVLVGKKGDGFVALLDRNLGTWGKWLWTGGALLIVLLFLAGLKRFLFGRPRERSD